MPEREGGRTKLERGVRMPLPAHGRAGKPAPDPSPGLLTLVTPTVC